MLRKNLARATLCLSLAVCAGVGVSMREARAQTDNPPPGDAGSSVYMWKDASGKCPIVCDNNQYKCPCRS